jgi:prepilin-type processing-associated H-X9-DG protein
VVGPEDVVDGLSQTACVSERLVTLRQDVRLSESELASDPLRFLWYVPRYYSDLNEFLQACRCERTTQAPASFHYAFVGYDHNLPPNTPGCQNTDAASVSPSSPANFATPAITATSYHPGTVNVVMCDGSGRRVSDSIDLGVWRAIGTRNGSEVVTW